MKNKKSVISGVCMSMAGASILLSQSIDLETSKFLVPIFFILGSYFAYKFSIEVKDINAGSQFYLFQSIGMLVFAILIIFVASSLESLLNFVTYFMICFGFFEFTFGLMSLDKRKENRLSVIIYRFVTGVLTLVAAVILLYSTAKNPIQGLMIAGALMLIYGIASVVFSQVLESES